MTHKMKFAVEDIHLLDDEQIDKSQFSLLRVDAFATGKSLHDTFVTEETLRETAKTILQKPFVFEMDSRFDDLGTHSDKEIAGGFVPHNSRLDFKKLDDGRVMLSCDVLIWKRYSNNLIEYFQRDGGKKGVSVEIEVFETREDKESGLLELCNFAFQAITGLGDLISPAIPNAQAVMAFSKEYEEAYELEFGRYDDLSFKIPSSVKSAAQQGLELRSKFGRGGTSVGLATARYLVKNDTATPEKVRHIAKYFPRHVAIANLDDKESNGWIAYQLWGGDAGRRWSTSLVKKMNELDDKKMSYFADEKNIDENENLQNSDEETIVVDNYLGIDSQNEGNTETGGQENNMAEKDEKEKEVVEEKEFNYAELFADEKFAEMFAEVEEDEEDEEREETEKESYAKAKEEFASGKNPAAVMSAMYSAMKRMSKRFAAMKEKMAKKDEDNKVYLAENEDLKKRFAEQEEKEKEMAVSDFMKDMSAKVEMSEEQSNEMKEKAKEYSYAQLDAWKNEVKAFAFDFKPKIQNEEDKSIVTYALPFNSFETPQTTNVWDNLSK